MELEIENMKMVLWDVRLVLVVVGLIPLKWQSTLPEGEFY